MSARVRAFLLSDTFFAFNVAVSSSIAVDVVVRDLGKIVAVPLDVLLLARAGTFATYGKIHEGPGMR